MYAKDLGLNEAFSFVRARKPDISPNFHFMEQLYTFERQLKNDPNRRMNVTSASSSTTTPSPFEPGNTPSSTTSSVSSRDNRSMRYRQIKYSCACNETECKCMQQEFLLEPMSHMSHIGVSPDSGRLLIPLYCYCLTVFFGHTTFIVIECFFLHIHSVFQERHRQ